MAHATFRPRDFLRRSALLAVMVGAMTTLIACGAETAKEGTPSGTSSAAVPTVGTGGAPLPDWPPCSGVWVADEEVPEGYAGCLDGDVAVEADTQRCSAGQTLVTYDDRFYAVLGGPVNQTEGLTDDNAYEQAHTACVG